MSQHLACSRLQDSGKKDRKRLLKTAWGLGKENEVDQNQTPKTNFSLPAVFRSLAFRCCALFSLLVRFLRSSTLTNSLAQATERLIYSHPPTPTKFARSVRRLLNCLRMTFHFPPPLFICWTVSSLQDGHLWDQH